MKTESNISTEVTKRADALQSLRDNIAASQPWHVELSLDVHIAELRLLAKKYEAESSE